MTTSTTIHTSPGGRTEMFPDESLEPELRRRSAKYAIKLAPGQRRFMANVKQKRSTSR